MALFLLVLVAASGPSAAAAGARSSERSTSGRIYFYGDLGNPVNSPYMKNPLLFRPGGFPLFEDGSWTLGKLHWRGWGSPVARATGISSSSNCTPSCATGKRTNVPAKLTLSSPGRISGHLVYRCYRLTIPSHPQSDQHDCLERSGKSIGYSPVSVPGPSPAPKSTGTGFFSPSHNIVCSLSQSGVFCDIYSPLPGAMAEIAADGHVTIDRRGAGNFGEGERGFHVLPYGSSATAGRFRCKSALAGVTCVVTATGKGFFLSRQSVKRVG